MLRLFVFLGMLIAIGTWEALLPRRRRGVSRRQRRPSNLGIAALNTLVLRVAFPLAAVGLGAVGEARGLGPLEHRAPAGMARVPARLDRVLRWVVVTPDMHRVHHSAVPNETNGNFGFNLPWWDRLLGTYRAQPAKGDQDMTIGLDEFRNPTQLRLDPMLAQPFVGPSGRHPINRRGTA